MADEQHIDPGTAAIASRLAIAVLVSIIASVTVAALASFQILFRIGKCPRASWPLSAPSCVRERRELGGANEGLGIGDRVDHRGNDALCAEVERAACDSECAREGCVRSAPSPQRGSPR